MSKLTDNAFIRDLYGDLRDRHLLPVIVVLIVAIVAVPILLRSEPEAAPPPPVDVIDEAATAAVPAVLVDDPGVRDYRKRLDALQNKNPFEAKFSLPNGGSSAVEDVSAGSSVATGSSPDASTGTSTATDTSSTSFPSTSSSSDSTSPPVDVDVTEDDSTTVDGDGDGDQPPVEEEWFAYEYRIDVVVGRAGEAKPQENVKPLSLLPGKASPVLIYMGANDQADKAVFSVSRDVTSSSGDGICLPSAQMCEFLELGIGDQRTFEYAPAGPGGKFVIRLKDIRRVVVEKINRNPFEGASTKSNEVPSELSAWLGLGG
jgi:hypothetical protein